jgi:hypothetical protein
MDSDIELQDKAAIVHQSLEELQEFLSTLELQIHLGLFPGQSAIEPVEVVLPNGWAPISDTNAWLVDEF